jgi:hypothetical protein
MGIGLGSTAHPGSKPGYQQGGRKAGRSAAMGQQPAQEPAEPTRPLSVAERLRRYGTLTEETRPAPAALSGLTPKQRKRLERKHRHAVAKTRAAQS